MMTRFVEPSWRWALPVALAFGISPSAGAATFNWLQPGVNAQHTGYNASERILSKANVGNLTETWDEPTQLAITAPPVSSGNTVFALSTDGTLYARNATTGALLWTFVADKNGAQDYWGVAVSGSTVYVNCQIDYDNTIYQGHGGLCALNAKTGVEKWSYAIYNDNGTPVDSAPYSPPVIDGKHVIFGESDSISFAHVGYMLTLDATTGAVVTSVGNCADTLANDCDYVSSAPAAALGGALYYQSGTHNGPPGTQGAVCSRGETSTTAAWCFFHIDYNLALTVANGLVLFVEGTSSSSANLIALDWKTGAVVWSIPVASGTGTHFAPAVANGIAYFSLGFDGFNNLYAVSLKTKKIVWSYVGSGEGVSSGVSVANGVVFAECRSNAGTQCAFDAATGAVLRMDTPGGYSPATPLVANGAQIGVCNYNDLCRFAP